MHFQAVPLGVKIPNVHFFCEDNYHVVPEFYCVWSECIVCEHTSIIHKPCVRVCVRILQLTTHAHSKGTTRACYTEQHLCTLYPCIYKESRVIAQQTNIIPVHRATLYSAHKNPPYSMVCQCVLWAAQPTRPVWAHCTTFTCKYASWMPSTQSAQWL